MFLIVLLFVDCNSSLSIFFGVQAEGFEAGIALLKKQEEKQKTKKINVDTDSDSGSDDDSVSLRTLLPLVPLV